MRHGSNVLHPLRHFFAVAADGHPAIAVGAGCFQGLRPVGGYVDRNPIVQINIVAIAMKKLDFAGIAPYV